MQTYRSRPLPKTNHLEWREGVRRALVNLAFLFFILLLGEGILRKWVFSGIEQALGFVRDPILLLIYLLYPAYIYKLPKWVMPCLTICGAIILYSSIVTVVTFANPIVTLLGWRSYVFYVPLAFIISDTWNREDVGRFVRFYLWIVIPVAILVYAQFASPKTSWINKGTNDDIRSRFTVAFDIVRPYGPFTFAQAQGAFAAMSTAILLIAAEKRREFRVSTPLLAVAGGAILSMGALSGGRTYFVWAVLIVAAYCISALTQKDLFRGGGRVGLIACVLTAFVFVFVVAFPRAYESMAARQQVAVRSEGSTFGRALRVFSDVSEPFQHAPALGYGIGAGTNAALRFSGVRGFALGETDWGRIVNEMGPVPGLLVIVLRVGITIWLAILSLRVNFRTGDGTALTLFGFTGVLTLAAQTTGQNQLLSFCWFAVGLMLCLCRAPAGARKSSDQ